MPKKYDIDVIERERQVIEMRRAGQTFDEIANAIGYATPASAHHAYTRALKRTLITAGTEEIREQELDRLERLQTFAWVEAERGNLKAMETVLKIMQRRARLLGLDAPIKTQQEVTVFEGGTELDREVQRLAELLATNRHGDSGGVPADLGEPASTE